MKANTLHQQVRYPLEAFVVCWSCRVPPAICWFLVMMGSRVVKIGVHIGKLFPFLVTASQSITWSQVVQKCRFMHLVMVGYMLLWMRAKPSRLLVLMQHTRTSKRLLLSRKLYTGVLVSLYIGVVMEAKRGLY